MERATHLLHRLTSLTRFDPESVWDPPVPDARVLMDLETNDLTRFPWPHKRYPSSLARLPLPRSLPTTSAPACSVLAGTATTERNDLDVGQLARLLFLSSGVVRTMSGPYGTYLFRAAGSAGGRFPLEVYVSAPRGSVAGLDAGVYFYDPLDHALVRVGPPPRDEGCTSIVVTGVPWRTGWRYRERGFRHVYWDAGTMLAQLLAAADSSGVAAELLTGFSDRDVSSLVGADGVHEWPVAVVVLGGATPAIEPGGQAEAGEVDSTPVEFPLVTAAQRAGDRDGLAAPWDRGSPVADLDPRTDETGTVESVIRKRGSQRRMDPGGQISADVYRICLGVGLRGIALPHREVVSAVGDVRPGLYRSPDAATPSRAGDLRGELYELCMQQDLARDAAFVVIAATDINTLDDHQYREAHLAAGLVEGRLHLLAYALGSSASGMTFVDGRMPPFLGEALDGLLCTCVGVPEYLPRPGGPPGEPVEVGGVAPRMSGG